MNNKSQAFQIFAKFNAFVLNQFNTTVKCLQSNGGGEFFSKMFVKFVAKLPTQLCYHTCTHAAFLINRMPCKTLSMKSPYQLLFGKKKT